MVQMRLQPETIAKVDKLKNFYKTSNRTKAVSNAITMAETILDGIVNKRSIVIELHNGERREVVIVGVDTSDQ